MEAGLSPRVRGNRDTGLVSTPQSGSIPARAGEPLPAFGVFRSGRVYPRACGGTRSQHNLGFTHSGLSPRVRGNQKYTEDEIDLLRSIPARAGEPAAVAPRLQPSGVYPRACGGTEAIDEDHADVEGLSPRVRGNLNAPCRVFRRLGSIPARAGEPYHENHSTLPRRVYPRACGGTRGRESSFRHRKGLSPRVRGNHSPGETGATSGGSIPARAGEPIPSRFSMTSKGVYPRACGGTLTAELNAVVMPVYPRACGGTLASRRAAGTDLGLSPRVRGNLRHRLDCSHISGSIPARAGEPVGKDRVNPSPGVYPRACGGTSNDAFLLFAMLGLSPRVRGNPGRC